MVLSKQHKEFQKIWIGTLPNLYDFLFQIYGEEQASVEILKKIYSDAARRYGNEKYQRYLQLWLYQICVQAVQKHYPRFLSEQDVKYKAPFHSLTLKERIVVLLVDRLHLKVTQVAAVIQEPKGRCGMILVYAREKLLPEKFPYTLHMMARIVVNEDIAADPSDYGRAIQRVKESVKTLPQAQVPESEYRVTENAFVRLWDFLRDFQWAKLSWKYKFAVETLAFASLGVLAIIVLPWMSDRINYNALMDGRLADTFIVAPRENKEVAWNEITAERLLASADRAEHESEQATPKDEFAEMDFPSGDIAEAGAAPIAPSRQSASVYRLILQSPSPIEMAERMKEIFNDQQVRERELSGSVMPGGVYFDGVTTEATYTKIKEAVGKLGTTTAYASQFSKRPPGERARVIVWIQQI